MRDMAGKIAELKFEAPLARFEEEETASLKNMNLLTEHLLDASLEVNFTENCNANDSSLTNHENGTDIFQEGTFSPFSGSLEDLVNTFDEKITSCFRDYATDVETLAPVQVRTQEEIMNECQMWWTITGTFGSILPIDWSKSYARKMHMPALNLNEMPVATMARPELEDLSSEDEAVATDLDMHALILSSSTDATHSPEEPLKTAEEVLREIDDIMQEDSPSIERSPDTDGSMLDTDEALERSREVLGSPLYEQKLKQLSSSELIGILGEMEALVGALSETLIAELALRDELEFEKELKNQFISLLLAVQNRRRQHHVTKKRGNGTSPLPQHRSLQESKYLTTVIPYHTDNGPPNNQALQVLIKILKAINEDSPTVPTLLTDYILKVLCPT